MQKYCTQDRCTLDSATENTKFIDDDDQIQSTTTTPKRKKNNLNSILTNRFQLIHGRGGENHIGQ